MDASYYQSKVDKLNKVRHQIQMAIKEIEQCITDFSSVNGVMDVICINGKYMAQDTRDNIDNNLSSSKSILLLMKSECTDLIVKYEALRDSCLIEESKQEIE